uniref:CSON009721 protein n=1 Tax=Culicoides sonorensis TaxID=179676 RepID=A0A336LL61_CULSO
MSAATCIICFTHFSEELEIVVLNCHHCFHRRCISQWLKIRQVCPQCNAIVRDREVFRIILSFDAWDPATFEQRTEVDQLLIERLDARILDLEQQIKSKDFIIEETKETQNLTIKPLKDELESKDLMIAKLQHEKCQLNEKLFKLEKKVETQKLKFTLAVQKFLADMKVDKIPKMIEIFDSNQVKSAVPENLKSREVKLIPIDEPEPDYDV